LRAIVVVSGCTQYVLTLRVNQAASRSSVPTARGDQFDAHVEKIKDMTFQSFSA
jgi:hypothetical protein